MDGGGSMQNNEERSAEKLMDDYLKSLGLHRKKIAKDGSCLFRAVAEQVLHCQSLHTEVRAKCVEFLKQNREIYEAFVEGDFEEYLYKLQDPQQWVGEVEINALAVMYKRDFMIFQEPGKPAVKITDNSFKDKVQLCFLNGNHYDSVYPVNHIRNAAVCQSILYELLYDGVFKVDRSCLGACQRNPRPFDLLSDDNMNACASSDESDLDAGEPLWVENGTSTTTTRHSRGRGRGRYLSVSDRVRRSLNPTLFRNIEYDVWHKTKRAQQKMDYCIAAGMQFTAGDRCQVRIDGRNYNANIKEVPPNNGPVTVYIDELGRRQVSLWNLRPQNDENSWSTVVNRDKRISNGHGEWEERGRGRGRGKHLPASSSVSQATAPGSSGRVQKQHSWPPQANVEEQGGAKANRKSVSSVEAAFGLTEEQRLAKEEEERNVALVEIQLRDEHSFPALGAQPGTQGDGGRKKGGEKKKSQRNKTKSPVEDIRAPSPSAGERPKSTTPPLPATSAAAPPTDTTTPSNSTPPAAKPPAAPSANSDSSPACLSSIKAPSPDVNVATTTAAAQAAASIPTSTCAAPPAKTNAPSNALAARAPSSSPPPAAASADSDSSPAWLSSLKAPSPDVNMDATVATAAASVSTSTSAAPTAKTNAPSNALASFPPPPPAAAASSTKPPVTGVAVPPSVPSSASLISHLPPALPAASSPPTPHTLSSSSPPPSSTSTASPPPSSSLPPPTFIAPIAPSPAAAQGFVPRSTPPLPSFHHSPSPPSSSSSSVQNSSSSSVMHHVAPTHEAPPVSAQTPSIGGTLTAPQTFHSPASLSHIHPQVSQSHVSVSQTQNLDRTQTSLPSNQIVMPQMQTEAQSSVPQSSVPQPSVPQPSVPQPCPLHLQHQPQSHTEVTSLPQTQIHPSVPHLQPQSQSQSEVVQVPHTSQASLPVSVQPHPHVHVHPAQPPHPSQLPHPALSLSTSPTHPSLQPQTSDTQNPTEAPPPPPLHTQPNSQPQQSHPPHPSHHPPPIPGTVPLQQLSQLYQDPLYPGFPQGEKGDVVPPPLMSSNKSGDDLPQDVNILRFFFNLGVKAYTMPYFPPYLYLLPLQQAHTMHPKLPSRSPSPTPTPTPPYPPFNPPTRHQEAYPHPQYPPTSASLPPQFDHQAPLAEPPHHSDPSFNQAGYPVTQPPPHRVSWQDTQIPPPRNPSFPVRYPTPSPAFPVPPQLSQGYHPGQGPGHQLYPPSVSTYPPASLGYPSLSAHEEHQVSQGVMDQRQPTNGDMMRGQGPSRVPGPAGAAANLANANNNRTMVAPGFWGDNLQNVSMQLLPAGFSFPSAYKKEQGDGLSGTVLLLDPPLNNKPIHVPNPAVKDVPVSMTTMKTSNIPTFDIISKTTVPGDNNHHSSRGYRGHQKPLYPTNTYVPLGAPEPSQVGFLSNVAMEAPLSVGCNTDDDWDEQMGYKPPTSNYRGQRRNRGGGGGGGRGRGGYEPGRGGPRRRHGGEPGAGFGQYSTFHRGRGRERGGY